MDKDIGKEGLKKSKSFKKNVILEYVYIISSMVILYLVLPYLIEGMVGEETGIGQALGALIIVRLLIYIIVFIVMVINPIKNLIVYKNEIKKVFPKFKKIICAIIIIFPVIFSSLILFQVPISNFIFDMKYRTGKNGYAVKSENYKLPIEFYNELKERGLLYDNDTYELMNKLNADHDCTNYIHKNGNIIPQRCYNEATMVGIEGEIYYDSIDNETIENMHQDPFPMYIYNAILTLPNKNEKMQYAALGRFSYNSDDYGDYNAKFKDYYIECKILYVDGNIYAIIGVGESYNINDFFKHETKIGSDNKSYNMILSEKDTVTTYYDGKYYPDGAIINNSHRLEISPNTNDREWDDYYPVRKVDKLDIHAINAIAEELQNGILNDSIECHFNKLMN